jgi:ferredoxin--NADP+ reductase
MDAAVATLSSPPLPARALRTTEPNAVLVSRTDLTPFMAIFRVRPDGPVPAFEPGQYLTLGITVEGRLVQRPYSTSSAAGTTDELEFLIRLVPGATFTPLLWALPDGSRIRLGPPKGLFRLERGDTRTHLFVATGTGLAPFVSMVRTALGPARATAPRAIVVHGVSREPELAYRDLLSHWGREHLNVVYRPVLSRPPDIAPGGWPGHVGRLDTALGPIAAELAVDPTDTVAYVCGNPGMIASVEAILRGRGFPETAVRTEGYWVP